MPILDCLLAVAPPRRRLGPGPGGLRGAEGLGALLVLLVLGAALLA